MGFGHASIGQLENQALDIRRHMVTAMFSIGQEACQVGRGPRADVRVYLNEGR